MKSFRLSVTQIGHTCDFKLRWGRGRQLSARVDSPNLQRPYQQWRSAYQAYYRNLRGRVTFHGSIAAPPSDWQAALRDAEEALLRQFHRWLLSPDLTEIRREIVQATRKDPDAPPHWVNVFLTCTPELARLPWESWEIGTDLGAAGTIRIARVPENMRHEPVVPIRRKARILAILGDDTGLDFEADRKAVQSLARQATVEFVGWRQGQDAPNDGFAALKQRICGAIADDRGWDILFFAGHSNESELTGGEFAIAPGASFSLNEIAPSLQQAKQNGLQFAIFNSCSGIDIAESLIDLGLSQVVVMREPIHNRVAQDFLRQFLQSLAAYKDVHAALLDASHFLQTQEKRLTYPSAYLVPSLFCDPEAERFRLEPFGWRQRIERWLPARREAIGLSALLLLSLVPPIQDLLLEPRIALQAVYRTVTRQLPPAEQSPVVLVQIECDAVCRDRTPDDPNRKLFKADDQRRYIDYGYLGRLVERLAAANPVAIGIDFVLDRETEQPAGTDRLAQSVRQAAERGTWLVFAANAEKGIGVSDAIADLNWSLEGDIAFYLGFVELPATLERCRETCPFSYLLALSHRLQQTPSAANLRPILKRQSQKRQSQNHQGNLKQRLISAAQRAAQTAAQRAVQTSTQASNLAAFLQRARLSPLTQLSQTFAQEWFHPLNDFSLPPSRVYQRLSDCQILATPCPDPAVSRQQLQQILAQKTVLIVPGYKGAGIDEEDSDLAILPLSLSFWGERPDGQRVNRPDGKFPKGEGHAYMVHHLLVPRWLIPVPDVLMVLLAALLGKGAVLWVRDRPQQRQRWRRVFLSANALYLLISLQLYLWPAVLFPWLLPSLSFWFYVRPALTRRTHHA